MGFLFPLFPLFPTLVLPVWSDEFSLPVLLKGVGLGLLLSTGVVIFVNYLEANIVYVCALMGIIAMSLIAEVVMMELRLFAVTHPLETAAGSDAITAIGFELETVRALQIQPILEANILATHLCDPETLTEIAKLDSVLLALIRRNYYIFNYLDGYLKNETAGCLRLIQSRPVGEIAVSSTMFRVLVNAINVSKVTREVDATMRYFDREPAVRLLMSEHKKFFRSMKEYVEERIRIQKFNSLRTLHGLLRNMAEEYD
jgi:hypothetical protein